MIDKQKLKLLKLRLARLSSAELNHLSSYCRQRALVVANKEWDKKAATKWEEVKTWKRGQVVYCCASGTFMGGPMQRGDSAVIWMIQPRKKLLWLTISGETFQRLFRPGSVLRYGLSPDPPDDPMSKKDKAAAGVMGKILESALA